MQWAQIVSAEYHLVSVEETIWEKRQGDLVKEVTAEGKRGSRPELTLSLGSPDQEVHPYSMWDHR